MGLKPAIDVVLSGAALLLLPPVLLLAALLVRLRLGSPVLFRQVRPGLDSEPFEVLKFRTMTDAVDASGALLPDEQRSLVGPRPLFVRYLDRYTPEQARRHDVRPGITGLAQVRGRNDLSWDAAEGMAIGAEEFMGTECKGSGQPESCRQ